MFSQHRNFAFLAALLVLSPILNQLATLGATGKTETREVAHQAKSDQQPARVDISRQRIFAPHWTTEAGFQTTIYIRNVHIQQPVTTHLSLVLDHRTIVLPSTTINPLQTIAIDIAKMLEESNEKVDQSGGAILEFDAESEGQINAYAHVLNASKSLAFTFPFMPNGTSAPGPLESVVWYYSKKTEAFVALQNTSSTRVTATTTIFMAGRPVHLAKVNLSANSIATFKIPTANYSTAGDQTVPQTAGVRLESSGAPGTVVAQGWLADNDIGFSAPFTFQHKSSCNCTDTGQHQYGTGVMIGDGGMMAPGTIFSPYLALRNNSSNPITISPIFSFDVAGSTQKVSLPAISLTSQQSTSLNLREFQLKGLIPANVQMGDIDLQYQGEAGALTSELASVDQHGSFVSPVPLMCRGVKDTHMAFWRTDGDWHSSVTIQNLASEENEMEITISYPGGTYAFVKRVPAKTTAMLSVNELQQLQTPDDSGRRIPVEATFGGVNIWSRNLNDGIVTNAMLVNPVTKTCGGCGSNGYVLSTFPAESTANNQTATGFQTHDCGDQFGMKIVLTFSTGYKGQDNCSGMHCSDTSVADMSGSNMVCYGAGTTGVTGFTANPWPTSSDCSTYVPVYTYGTLPVRPKISGPNSLWFFQNETPSGYATTITLTASPATASSYAWTISAGADKVNFVGGSTSETTTSNQIQAFSIFRSNANKDVSVQVTVNGQTSAAFKLTSYAPYKLAFIQNDDQVSGSYGYITYIHYSIRDQFGTTLPSDVPINEHFTTGVINDYSGTDWIRGTEGGTTVAPADWADQFGGQGLGATPASRPPCIPVCNVAVHHFDGYWKVGSTTIDVGAKVQTNTWQRYTDHARHTNVVSPPSP